MIDLSRAPARHEEKDVYIPGLLICAAVLLACVVISGVVSWWGFAYLQGRDRGKPSDFPLAVRSGRRLPPEPRLEGLDSLAGINVDTRMKERRILETYGWVDRKTGIVRMPIKQAMKFIIDGKLLPIRAQEEEAGQSTEHRPPSAANSGRGAWRAK